MKLNLWRALGVTAAVVITANLINTVIYAGPEYPLAPTTADSISFAASLVILAVLSVFYFRNGPIQASLSSGFLLGLVVLTYTFVNSFLVEYTQAALDTMLGLPGSVSIGVSMSWLPWVSALSGLFVPSLVGWFMAKKRS